MSGRHPAIRARHRAAVERAVESLRADPAHRPTLKQLAAAGHMSPYHFDRVFRRITGLPPMHYLGALRMQAAKRLLLTTELSVTEVCWDVGFRSLGSFSERFSRLVGISPSRFRALGTEDPERLLARALERIHQSGDPPQNRSRVFGRVEAEGPQAPIFLGLFSSDGPGGAPAACCILPAAGRFSMPAPRSEGRYRLFAVVLRWDCGAPALLLAERARRAAILGSGVVVRHHHDTGPIHLALRQPEPTEPPLVLSIPALLSSLQEPMARKIGV